jgi:hypothetical protein
MWSQHNNGHFETRNNCQAFTVTQAFPALQQNLNNIGNEFLNDMLFLYSSDITLSIIDTNNNQTQSQTQTREATDQAISQPCRGYLHI